MRNPARAVSKIRQTIEPLFVLSDCARLYVARPAWSFTYAVRRVHVRVLLHTPEHTFAHIMPPFMPRTCAEQLHFKITDFAARFVRKHARDNSPYLRAPPSPRRHESKISPSHSSYVPPPLTASILSRAANQFFASTVLIKNVWLRNERRDSNRRHLIY